MSSVRAKPTKNAVAMLRAAAVEELRIADERRAAAVEKLRLAEAAAASAAPVRYNWVPLVGYRLRHKVNDLNGVRVTHRATIQSRNGLVYVLARDGIEYPSVHAWAVANLRATRPGSSHYKPKLYIPNSPFSVRARGTKEWLSPVAALGVQEPSIRVQEL